jgi:hypothetical protein
MRKALLCCGPVMDKFSEFDEVWSLGILAERRLSHQGFVSLNLFDVELPDLDQVLRLRVEAGLEAEAARGGVTEWADIAYQRVHWRFIRYFQYRLRLERLLGEREVGHLTVSSREDCDLIQACVAACRSKRAELVLQEGPCDSPSSLLSFLAVFDLPHSVSLLDLLVSSLLALYYRAKNIRVFYQPYNNLAQGYPDAASLTWRRSICFASLTLPEIELRRTRSLLNLDTTIRHDQGSMFDPKAWPDFDSDDLTVLTSAFTDFQQHYNTYLIDRIYASCRTFFKQSRAQRLVLNSDNTCTTRLLSKAAKAQGLQVDYLPHGLIVEDLSLRTKTGCGVDRVLAWNPASAEAFERRGNLVEVIAHPSNAGGVMRKRLLPSDLSNLRVLILPPEWVGLSFAGRPDCFERDLLDVMEALNRLGVTSVHIKCHNSIKVVLDAKFSMLAALRPFAPIDFTVIDSRVSTPQLYEQFDLVIIGPTTGLLEASRSATPFIAFRSLLHKASLFSGFAFPAAESADELVQRVRDYDFDQVDRECERMARSLNAGSAPLAADLGARVEKPGSACARQSV